jgi:hypothetical protein
MKETIYNFRIKTVGEYYIPEFNHDIHGWIKIDADVVLNNENESQITDVFCVISSTLNTYKPKSKDFAIQIINKYKEKHELELIKYEYEYIMHH